MSQGNQARALAGIITMLAVSGCGADGIASPGAGSVTINNPAPTPTPSPTPTAPPTVTPAGGCPTIADPQGLTDSGTITGPTGTWRVCTLPARINRSIQLTKTAGVLYRLGGRVDVGTDGGPTATAADTNVTLTIDPGVIVFGGTGVSWLAVNRGNRINAVGSATAPIIFTSRDNVLGLNSDTSSGQWGGVVLMGRAQTTDCAAPGAAPGTIACERQVEGAADPALFGGATNTDSSGTMRFVQIRYSGFVLGADAELQSLTTGATGSGTVLENIQSFNSSDDGIELFGGRVNMKRLIVIGAEDDAIDTDTGVKGNIQYAIAIQRNGAGDSILEVDSDNAFDGQLPRQLTQISNATFVHASSGGNAAAMLMRGGADYSLVNSVLVSPNVTCLRISRTNTIQAANAAQDEAGPPLFRAVQMQCSATPFAGSNGVTAADAQSIFGAGSNGNSATYTPTLTNGYINGATENGITAFNATSLSTYFDSRSYIGAVQNASDTWFAGWTCNSSTANFGTGNSGLCTSLPTT